jgi:MoxR-like ATPase
MEEVISNIKTFGGKVKENVEKVIVGKGDVVELVIVALLCEGHVLIEDIPGVGKTVTGTYIFNQKTADFEFRPGPIMAQIVLTDEINRTTPRTQSALLEAMQERQVTAEGETKLLPRPFMVLATQNPIEQEGTFPLPEAQLDRFLIKIKIGYPSKEDDKLILSRFRQVDPLEELKPVVSAAELMQMQAACRNVHVSADVEDYIIRLIHATREHPTVELGASPRAMLALYHTSQVLASLRGRAFVIPDDVKYLTTVTLSHRIIPKAESSLRGNSAEQALKEIIESVPVPVENENMTRQE